MAIAKFAAVRRGSIIPQYQRSLLDWYHESGRDFPWRKTNDPFHILVGEILLRKTGASRVVSAYKHLVEKYPTPERMASASLEDLERVIQPLGLHNRAKVLLSLSQILQEDYDGAVPDDVSYLRTLPGVGEYIANAVACLSFGHDKALLDGGIGRVIRRVFGFSHAKPAYLDRELWDFAARILPRGRARDYNLALIDFAAQVCTFRNPSCTLCPLKQLCAQYGTGR